MEFGTKWWCSGEGGMYVAVHGVVCGGVLWCMVVCCGEWWGVVKCSCV